MHSRSFVTTWAVAFGFFATIASTAYALLPNGSGHETVLYYVLWPGIAVYALLNGSLLFGGGFGRIGNFLVIALGSAVAWAFLAVLLVHAVTLFARPRMR